MDAKRQERMRVGRAEAIAAAGGIEAALEAEGHPKRIDATVSELIVLGLMRQGVRTFVSVFGHGSTDIGEVLRVYEEAGLVRTVNVRSEINASHAAACSPCRDSRSVCTSSGRMYILGWPSGNRRSHSSTDGTSTTTDSAVISNSNTSDSLDPADHFQKYRPGANASSGRKTGS